MAEFGRKSKLNPELSTIASAAALLASLSSLILFVLVLVAVAPELTASLAWPLAAAGLVLAMVATYLIHGASNEHPFELPSTEGAFQISHAIMIAAIISAVSLCSAWLRTVFGDSGTLATAVVVGLVEIHAAAVGIAQLSPAHTDPSTTARWGVLGILAASVSSKVLLAYLSGDRAYGKKITTGLVLCLAAAMTVMLLMH